MRKLLIGAGAAMALALAGAFAATIFAQQRAEREVAAAFEAIRAAGASATHGKVEFDLWSRTLRVADVVVQPAGTTPAGLKAARLVATGVGRPAPGRLSAQRIEIDDLALEATVAAPAGLAMSYRAPRIVVTDYAGPAGPVGRLDTSSMLALSRIAVAQLVATSAGTVTLPALTARFSPGMTANGMPVAPIDYAYAGIEIRGIGGGRVAGASIEKVAFTSPGANGTGAIAGELAGVAVVEVDAAAALATLSPEGAKDERAHTIYGEVTAGAYTASLGDGVRMRIEGMILKELGLVPAKVPLAEIVALVEHAPAPGTPPSRAATRAILETVARLYDGLSLGRLEMRGLAMTLPDGGFRLAALRLESLSGGRLAELALEGLEAETGQKQPVRVARFALQGLDLAGLMRASAQLDRIGAQPTPGDVAALVKLLDGVALEGLVAPYQKTDKLVEVDRVAVAWARYVGPTPTQLRLSARMTGPIDLTDAEPFSLLAATGFDRATVALDLGTDWSAETRAFTIAPAAIEIADLAAVRATVAVGNVASDLFSLDPVRVMQAAAGVEAGPVEISLRDMGGLELAIRQYAAARGLARDAALAELTGELNQSAEVLTQASPDLAPLFAAAARFLETPGGTLTVKATPNARVPLMELLGLAPDQALAALSRFTIEASVRRGP